MTKKILAVMLVMMLVFSGFASYATTSDLVIYAGEEVATLNLTEDLTGPGCDGVIFAEESANVTITGDATVHGTLCGGAVCGDETCGYAMAVFARDNAVVNIEGGTYTNVVDPNMPDCSNLIYARDNGQINISGGIFKCATPAWTLNCKDRSEAKVTVTGGKFFEFNPTTANTEEGSGTGVAPAGYTEVVVPEGYIAVAVEEADGTWYVICNHSNLTEHAAVEPTYAEDGSIQYWECPTCGNYYADENGNTIIEDKTSVVIPKLVEVEDANAVVSDKAVENAIDEAGEDDIIVLPVADVEAEVDTVTVSTDAAEAVVGTEKDLAIVTENSVAIVDATALKEIVKQAQEAQAGDIKITVNTIEKESLTDEQKAAVADKDLAMVLSAEIFAGTKEISNFGGGTVTVMVPFTLGEGESFDDYKVYYVDDEGKLTEVAATYEENALVLELEHFSEYVVVNEKVEDDASAVVPSTPEKDETPKTGATSIVLAVVALAVVGLVVSKKERGF